MIVPPNILVVDDDDIMRDSCFQILRGSNCQVRAAETGDKALELMKKEFFDIVILDLKMPGLSGMEVLKWVKEENPETIVIVITGYATVDSAVEAMKNGAYDFLPKPFTPEELRVIVRRAMEKRQLILENIYLHQELRKNRVYDTIIGRSRAMHDINELVKKVGPTDSTVLITGESGTGKELIARAIHDHSIRKEKPFVTVDCSTLVENLFESELFGHVKGSFTGATATKHGRLELANSGTIFFDEIGNIGIAVQAKLLRAIQEREITKVGSNQAIKIDVRIIAATNKDLRKAVQDETFREDLFYRLSVVPIHLLPLRERKEDIPPLAEYFLNKYNDKRKKSIQGISASALKALIDYGWPGNVRELENAIERAVVLTDNQFIEPADLCYYGLSVQVEAFDKKALVDVEKEHIKKTLRLFKGHMQKTATALGINRKTLRLKMNKYGIHSPNEA
ncbi:sigma-54-dependent transcriptional regulator [bacterium]